MSYSIDARTEEYQTIELFGIPMLFSNFRLDHSTVPKGLYQYEVRHSDYEDSDPVEIRDYVLVNFWGTLLSRKPLRLDERGCRYVRRDEEWGFTGDSCSLHDYMDQHPPEVVKQQER